MPITLLNIITGVSRKQTTRRSGVHMNKMEEILNAAKLNELLNKKDAEEKKPSKTMIVFAIIGIVVAVAAAAYGIYRFFTPDYLDDFEDDFDDDFDDDFFEDEDDEAADKE